MGINTYKKSERLCSKKLIKELFNKGSSFYLYPYKIIFLKAPLEVNSDQVLFSVPKRNFKKAVDRNKVRRRSKEAYRLNKQLLQGGNYLLIAYIYTAKEILDYSVIEEKLKSILLRLHKDNEKVDEK